MIRRYFDSPSKDCGFMIEAGRNTVGTIALYNFADSGRACEWGRFVIAARVAKSWVLEGAFALAACARLLASGWNTKAALPGVCRKRGLFAHL